MEYMKFHGIRILFVSALRDPMECAHWSRNKWYVCHAGLLSTAVIQKFSAMQSSMKQYRAFHLPFFISANFGHNHQKWGTCYTPSFTYTHKLPFHRSHVIKTETVFSRKTSRQKVWWSIISHSNTKLLRPVSFVWLRLGHGKCEDFWSPYTSDWREEYILFYG